MTSPEDQIEQTIRRELAANARRRRLKEEQERRELLEKEQAERKVAREVNLVLGLGCLVSIAALVGVGAAGRAGYRWLWANHTATGRLCKQGVGADAEITAVSKPYNIRQPRPWAIPLELQAKTATFDINYQFKVDETVVPGAGRVDNFSGKVIKEYEIGAGGGARHETSKTTFDNGPKRGELLKIVYDPSDPQNNQPADTLQTECGGGPR